MSTQEYLAPRPALPALRRLYAQLAPYSYAFIRFVTGVFIIPHGYAKLFQGILAGFSATYMTRLGLEPPLAWGYLVAINEFAGGIMLALGLLTRFAAAALVIEFAVIVFVVKAGKGYFGFAGGWELEALYGLLCLAILFRGGERLSLDSLIGKEL